jgi:AcrR family transcriptional regulator
LPQTKLQLDRRNLRRFGLMPVMVVAIAAIVLALLAAPAKAAGRHRPQRRRVEQADVNPSPAAPPGAAGTDPNGSWLRLVTDASDTRRVVEAVIVLAAAGEQRPSEWHVAQLAGLTPRAVRNHLADEEGLLDAVRLAELDRHAAELAPIEGVASFAERLEHFVAQRQRLYEGLAAFNQAVLLPSTDRPGQDGPGPARQLLREHAAATFAPELAAAGDAAPALLDALDTATSWQSWDHLRSMVGRRPSRAARAMEMSVSRILGRPTSARAASEEAALG